MQTVDLIETGVEHVHSMLRNGLISPRQRDSLIGQVMGDLNATIEWEALIDDATDKGLEHSKAWLDPQQRVLHITVHDDDGAMWMTHLIRAGFGFSNPCAAYRIVGGTAAEAKDGRGLRVVLMMMEGV